MSSLVLYREGDVTAQWNKGAPYSVNVDGKGPVSHHAREDLAIRAARRLAADKREQQTGSRLRNPPPPLPY